MPSPISARQVFFLRFLAVRSEVNAAMLSDFVGQASPEENFTDEQFSHLCAHLQNVYKIEHALIASMESLLPPQTKE